MKTMSSGIRNFAPFQFLLSEVEPKNWFQVDQALNVPHPMIGHG